MGGDSSSKGMRKLDAALVRINKFSVGIMLMVMFVLVFGNVVTRYCFGFSIAAAEEISTFLMIWVTYLGAGLALREGKLASIDAIQDKLPSHWVRIIRIFLGCASIAFFALLVFYGVQFVSLGWSQETFALMIPRGIPYLVLPAGALLFALHFILFFKRWTQRQWERPHAHQDEDVMKGEKI